MKTDLIILLVLIQLNDISYPQSPNTYEIYAIAFAHSKYPYYGKDMAIGANSEDSVNDSFFFWYLSGNDGEKILVDAGFILDEKKPVPNLGEYVRPDSALLRINVKAEEITDIILTHPHWDHIGGIQLFDNAKVWMQENDYDYFVGDAWQKDANHEAFDKTDVLMIVQFNLEGRLQLIHGDSIEILPGIRAFKGSKHTFESQHLLVNTKTDQVMLASDDCWYYFNLGHLLSIPLVMDAKAYVNQLKRMKRQVSNTDLIMPGHDRLLLAKFPEIADGIVRIR